MDTDGKLSDNLRDLLIQVRNLRYYVNLTNKDKEPHNTTQKDKDELPL